jgi:hypothetical protein
VPDLRKASLTWPTPIFSHSLIVVDSGYFSTSRGQTADKLTASIAASGGSPSRYRNRWENRGGQLQHLPCDKEPVPGRAIFGTMVFGA